MAPHTHLHADIEPGWGECMRRASHALRVPGWIIAAVLLSHLACCTAVWGPWALDLSRRGLLMRPTTEAQEPPGEAPGEAQEQRVPSWRDIAAMDPMSIAAYAMGLSELHSPTQPTTQAQPQPQQSEKREESCPSVGARAGTAEPGPRDVASVLAIPAASFLAVWLPSAWNGARGGLRCLVATLGCLTGALGACTAALGIPVAGAGRAAACAAMHLAAQSIAATWYVLASCPGRCPPLEGCGNGIAQWTCSLSLAFLFFYLSHQHESAPLASYGALEFYASHMWGVALAEAVRALVNAPVLWAAGI